MKGNTNRKKKWRLCNSCGQTVFALEGVGLHKCPPKIAEKREAELDLVVNEELSTWEKDLKRFWNSKDVKFYEWMAEEKRI